MSDGPLISSFWPLRNHFHKLFSGAGAASFHPGPSILREGTFLFLDPTSQNLFNLLLFLYAVRPFQKTCRGIRQNGPFFPRTLSHHSVIQGGWGTYEHVCETSHEKVMFVVIHPVWLGPAAISFTRGSLMVFLHSTDWKQCSKPLRKCLESVP